MTSFTHKFKALNPWHFIWISILLSEVFMLAINSLSVLVFAGIRITARHLWMQGFATLVISFTVSFLVVNFVLKEQRKTEAALQESAGFLNTIFDSIRDPFSIVDRDFRIVKVNGAYAELKNIPAVEMLGADKCYKVLYGRNDICEDCVIQKTFVSANPSAKEKLIRWPDGSETWVEIYTYPIFDAGMQVSHAIEYIRDVTARKITENDRNKLIEKLHHLSRTDSLTGLLNKRVVLDRLEYEVDRAQRYGAPLAMAICDMDHFKEVNDTLGHAVGDKVMRVVSNCLVETVRKSDIVGRYGGDEFLMVLPQTFSDGASELAERIRESVERLSLGEECPIKLTMSIGIACFDGPGDDYPSLLKRADSALYTSKRAGRNKVSVI